MIKLINGDCLEKMKDIESGSVDMVFTDPPYKVTSRGGYTSAGGMMLDISMRKGNVFNHNSINIESWLPELYRILKESGHCYIMTNNKNITEFLNAINKSNFHFIKSLIWIKDNKIMSQAYMSQFEYVLFLRKGKFKRINNCGSSDVLSFKNLKTKGKDNKPIHPTEKPVDMIDYLILNSSVEKETIADPFMGCGSSGVACKNLNRNFIGIELDETYFNIAEQRIKDAGKPKQIQLELF